jgi:2-keto-4-pentenoate hydratase
MKSALHLALIAALLACAASNAAPPSAEAIQQFVDDYFAVRPSRALPRGMSQEEALHVQKEFVAKLSSKLGTPVGYKVGLVTNVLASVRPCAVCCFQRCC